MVEVIYAPFFETKFKKIKNESLKERIIKQIIKIKNNPEIGKPMMHDRKGTRELYIKPYRLSYRIQDKIIYVLDIYHKNKQ
ncbi:type II toxin-antitoxin system RelE/ParE family toxin [Candidatus Woesearchaeota archaeon]|nr:type II toxin-antitoxin system RelE/ParE family toxin [Candidatus Woesearchaeota archaeon]